MENDKFGRTGMTQINPSTWYIISFKTDADLNTSVVWCKNDNNFTWRINRKQGNIFVGKKILFLNPKGNNIC
jgi:hypothetical protein